MNYFDTKIPPPDFSPKWEVSGCFCVYRDRILLLRRHPNKPYGNTWSLPAGKLEQKETPLYAIVRELQEEIGLVLDAQKFSYVDRLYARIPGVDYTFHMFLIEFDSFPSLRLAESENSDYVWCKREEALRLPLILGGKEALDIYAKYDQKGSSS